MKILIVEDSYDSREMLSMLLDLHGHTTACAESGKAALELVKKFEPDCVITDLGLPDMDGVELIRTIRSRFEFNSIHLIALSCRNDRSTRHDARDAGANYFVAKGDDITNLLIHLSTNLSRGDL